jgi:hypothetical protein
MQCILIAFDLAIISLFLLLKPLANLLLTTLSDCIFTRLGILCPACGGTRAVFYFASGNFSESFHYNPFFFLLIIYFFLFVIIWNLEIFLNLKFAKKLRAKMHHPKTVIIFAILYVIFGIVRNLIPSLSIL